jgi:hypothetical protein
MVRIFFENVKWHLSPPPQIWTKVRTEEKEEIYQILTIKIESI